MNAADGLERLSHERLRDYLRNRLLGRASEPPVAWSHDDVPERFVKDAYTLSQDEEFRARLKSAVGQLLEAWRPSGNDGADYGARLVYLTGALGVEGGAGMLKSLASRASVQELYSGGRWLPDLALASLLEFPGQEADAAWWRAKLEDPRTYDTAFLAVSLKGAEEGLDALPRFLQMAFSQGLHDLVIQLRVGALVDRHLQGDSQGLRRLRSIVESLPEAVRQRAEDVVRKRVPQAWETAIS